MSAPPEVEVRLRVAALACKAALLLLTGQFVEPYETLGWLALLANMALIDRAACGVAPEFDENAVLWALLGARGLNLLRSGGAPPRSALTEYALDGAWALLACGCLCHARRPAGPLGWLPVSMSALGALASGSTYAPFEPAWMYTARGVCFVCLAAMLHLRPAPPGALVAGRGFLPCFAPVLVAKWHVAAALGACAGWQLAWMELREAPRPHAYHPLSADEPV